jgi:hypothetical protein
MSKYLNLTLHLAPMEGKEWEAGFEEIEDILGFPLPKSAWEYPAWWANQGRAQSLAWQNAGWHTSEVDTLGGRVKFVYVGERSEDGESPVKSLTISEAKAGLAATFGVPMESIEILIRG